MLLKEFFNYKNKIMELFCNNKELVQLIMDEDYTEDFDGLTLPYIRIFPFEFVPETVGKGETYICFDVDVPVVTNEVICTPVIYIWIFTHKTKMRLSEGGVRVDKMAEIIDEILNGSRDIGLGELDLKTVSRFVPIQDFQGRVLVYEARETNRPGVKRRPPTKRF